MRERLRMSMRVEIITMTMCNYYNDVRNDYRSRLVVVVVVVVLVVYCSCSCSCSVVSSSTSTF